MKKGNGNIIFTVVCIVLVLWCVIDDSVNSTKHTSYSSSSYNSRTCAVTGCLSNPVSGSNYCSHHICKKLGCHSQVVSGSSYCYIHKPSTTSSGTSSYHYSNSSSSTRKYSNSGNTKKNDPYDVYDYDNADDFAEEWAEEFGDGDYDDGYDDAYDYWEDERG